MRSAVAIFDSEADLCRAFISQLPAGWTAYPETGGFDIMLVRDVDGCQIGIEAKLTLNAKVVEQIAPPDHWYGETPDVDFRAVLVPYGRSSGLSAVCRLIGVTVIQMVSKKIYVAWDPWQRRNYGKFTPELPTIKDDSWSHWRSTWTDRCPTRRIDLPDYIPDVTAGASAPIQLSMWKIAAIKLCIVLERQGFVTRQDFQHFKVSPTRWTQHWLERGTTKGQYIRGPYTPDFRAAHPVNYAQIEADYEKWKRPEEQT